VPAPLASAGHRARQTTAARQVAVKAEPAVVISDAAAQRATVVQAMCCAKTGPGPRGAQLKEGAGPSRRRPGRRVPEAQAAWRGAGTRRKPDQAQRRAKVGKAGFSSQTTLATAEATAAAARASVSSAKRG